VISIKKPFILIQVYLIVFLFFVGLPLCAQENGLSKKIVGWVECAFIEKVGIEIIAKLDSGADNSSLNVDKLFEFKSDGFNFFCFEIVNYKGQKEVIEAKVTRIARIKRHESMSDHRPVIFLDRYLGKTCKNAEVNLVDRSKYKYQLLLGGSFLKDDFLVDPSKMLILPPPMSMRIPDNH